ncbi:MAG TPA: phenylalanine--tRNA ligase subunit beta [Vicinamibacterales bacterium]|nr:phenylalanine--tRNA ligase subunit beta [Vicinamibacterales bacterium]
MKIVLPWLRDLVHVPDDAERVAHEISLRGFEVAAIEPGTNAVIDFEITANRPDCMNHLGIAREASAIWDLPLRLPETSAVPAGPSEPLEVTIEAPDLCPRYCAQVFEMKIGPSPPWLADRLTAAGVRPISNIVDLTNYVMLEIGQPMHAFDLEKLGGRALVIRRARPGEKMRTLDGVDRALEPDMLVIADAARASAAAGVMGGQESEIGSTTRLMALESAYFHPPSIRRTSKRLGLKTEASIRFERGGDIDAAPAGIARFAALAADIGAATPRGSLIDRYPAPRQRPVLRVRASRISRLLGQEVPASDVTKILTALGFAVVADGDGDSPGWRVTVPTFRVDVTREADLIEEVGRHYGFDRLPTTFPALAAPQPAPPAGLALERLVRQVLTAAGFSEASTFAFQEREAALPFCDAGAEPAAIANPLSEKFAVLRPSMLPGLVDSCAHNRRRERRDIQLFETGSRFGSGAGTAEGRALGFVWCGSAATPHWSHPTRAVDFFDAKGIVDAVCAAAGVTPEFAPATRPYLVPGRTAEVRTSRESASVVLGVVGQILPAIADARGIPAAESVYAAEIDLRSLAAAGRGDDLLVESLPRFPSIVRDISMLVDDTLPAAAVRGTIRSAAPSTLVSIAEFDRYQGKGVPEGRVSLSLRLTFRAADRTLTDDDAQDATDHIVDALRTAHGAERR